MERQMILVATVVVFVLSFQVMGVLGQDWESILGDYQKTSFSPSSNISALNTTAILSGIPIPTYSNMVATKSGILFTCHTNGTLFGLEENTFGVKFSEVVIENAYITNDFMQYMAISPNQKYLIGLFGNAERNASIYILDLSTYQSFIVSNVLNGNPSGIAISYENQLFVSVSKSPYFSSQAYLLCYNLTLINETNTHLALIWTYHELGRNYRLSDMSLDPLNKYLYVTNGNNTLLKFEASSGKIVWQHYFSVSSALDLTPVYVSYKGSELLLVQRQMASLTAVDAKNGSVIWSLSNIMSPYVPAVNLKYGLVATIGGNSSNLQAIVIHVNTGAVEAGSVYSIPALFISNIVFGGNNVFATIIGNGSNVPQQLYTFNGENSEILWFTTLLNTQSSPSLIIGANNQLYASTGPCKFVPRQLNHTTSSVSIN